jgi:5-methylcytosine-specific restriction enzyme A
MPRAKKLCSNPDCTNPQPCPTHNRAWSTSTRQQHSTLSGSRQQQRARYILQRDDTICHICGRPGSNEADHIIPLAHGGADSIENMAAIHGGPGSCHEQKTTAEAHAGASR